MGLKDLLLQRAGNLGNLKETSEVTGEPLTEQSGNLGNLGNLGNQVVEGVKAQADGQKDSRELLFSEVTKVTEVTAMKSKAESGNLNTAREVTEVTDRAAWQGEYEDALTARP